VLWNFNLGRRKAGSRERLAACIRTLRRDCQRPRRPEGLPAWITTTPRWEWAPTAVLYDTVQFLASRTLFTSVVSMKRIPVSRALRSSGRSGPKTYPIHSTQPSLLIHQSIATETHSCVVDSFPLVISSPALSTSRAHLFAAPHFRFSRSTMFSPELAYRSAYNATVSNIGRGKGKVGGRPVADRVGVYAYCSLDEPSLLETAL
jgi:hypothetical protein